MPHSFQNTISVKSGIPVWIGGFCIGLVLITFFLATVANMYRPVAYGFEVLMLLGVFGVAAASRRFRQVFRRVHPVYSLLLSGVLLASFWAQMLDDSSSTYPFVSWTMYTEREPEPVYWEFSATHADGTSSGLIPPFHPLRIRTFSRNLTAALLAEEEGVASASEPGYEDLVRGLAHMRRDAEKNPIQYVDAFKVELPRDFTGGIDIKQVTLMRRVTIEP